MLGLRPYQGEESVAVITGACGGMGKACSRLLGRRYRLILADLGAERVEAEAETLRDAGYDVPAAIACDVGKPDDVCALAATVAGIGALGTLVHTAGLSPAFAEWQRILQVNAIGTALLLDAFLPQAKIGSVAICVASMAGYWFTSDQEMDAILDEPLAQDFMTRLEPLARSVCMNDSPFGTVAYAISKYAVIRMCEQRVANWAASGARIVSISPGAVYTTMGKKETEEGTAGNAMLAMTPIGRWGTPMDVANLVDFLASGLAGFITGCDLRIDGGATPVLSRAMAGQT